MFLYRIMKCVFDSLDQRTIKNLVHENNFLNPFEVVKQNIFAATLPTNISNERERTNHGINIKKK